MKRSYNTIDANHFLCCRCIEGENAYGGKALSLLITREERVTPSGLKILAGTTSCLKNFKFFRDKPYPLNDNTSLKEAILCSDHFQSIYTQLLCGFYQRHDVTHVKSVFASSLVSVIHFLKRHYSELCSDISSGSLSPKITDPSLRGRMIETFMQNPDPELAKFIQVTCSDENWEGIYRKIWPNIKYLDAISTGSMAQYILLLKYYTGGLPLLSTKYSASECDLGFNLNPMCDPYDVSYTIMPNMSYYEFLPLDSSHFTSSDPKPLTVEMADVEVGKEYEVVVTNFCGLYRYRIGDVLSPTRFFNSTPQFKFIRRKNVVLTIDICKLTEMELQKGIDSVSSLLGQLDIIVVEYTSYANVKDGPGHCVIYMELMVMSQANWPKPEVLEQCCQAMEGSLGQLYFSTRVSGFIGPLEIRLVENGTFEKLRDYAISKGVSFTQYKVPRCVKALDLLELLNSGVVSIHFSSSFPTSGP
ncbi:indole-3-acetic acid-amido synthetase GH3.3-like [Silene latifolia]|uniref:indole-3-acetic acid-amido synthetase GH3.3-like n=1 Tax=Silene latifolia TaxID=37657 RepID=UPI003D76F3D8